MIHVRIITILDDPAFFHGKGRILYNGSFQKGKQILQIIHIFIDFLHFFTGKSFYQCFDMRKHGNGGAKCNQISWIRRLIADSSNEALQVINRIQIFPDLFPVHFSFFQFFDCIQTVLNRFFVNQRLLDERPEHAGSHGCFGFIQNPEKRTTFYFVPQGLRKFQIASAGTVYEHITFGCIRRNGTHMIQSGFLGIQQIRKKRTGGNRGAFVIL